MKANTDDFNLHQKLVYQDETASSQLFFDYYDKLVNYFTKVFSFLDAEVISEIVADSLFKFIEQPAKYDPGKGTLEKYLLADVRGDIKNHLQKKKPVFVELGEDNWNSSISRDVETNFIHQDLIDAVYIKLKEICENRTDFLIAEQIVCFNERDNGVYAELLGIGQNEKSYIINEVKKHKDRIKLRLKRKGFYEYIHKLKSNE